MRNADIWLHTDSGADFSALDSIIKLHKRQLIFLIGWATNSFPRQFLICGIGRLPYTESFIYVVIIVLNTKLTCILVSSLLIIKI
jgi:hypothetical protein